MGRLDPPSSLFAGPQAVRYQLVAAAHRIAKLSTADLALLVDAADRAPYASERDGRNRVTRSEVIDRDERSKSGTTPTSPYRGWMTRAHCHGVPLVDG
jgi:hypothetical protein